MFRNWFWGSKTQDKTEVKNTQVIPSVDTAKKPHVQATHETPSSTGDTPTNTGDNPVPQSDSNRTTTNDSVGRSDTDALGLLQKKLKDNETKMAQDLEQWKKKKIDIEATLQDNSSPLEPVLDKKSLKQKILEVLKSFVLSPEKNLDDAFKETAPHVLALCGQIDAASKELEKTSGKSLEKSEAEKKLELFMCTESIEILNQLIELSNDIEREINICLKLENGGEVGAKILAQVGFKFLSSGVPLLDFNFTMSDLYRQYLYHRIHNQTDHMVDDFMVDAEGTVAKASAVLDKQSSQKLPTTEPNKKTTPSKEKLEKVAQVGGAEYQKYLQQTFYNPHTNVRNYEDDKKHGLQRTNSSPNIQLPRLK